MKNYLKALYCTRPSHFLDLVKCEGSDVCDEIFVAAGASKCSWSSCREGCTTDLYECNHVYVEYSPLSEDREMISTNRSSSHLPPPTESSNQVAVLFVNIRACGYPPSTVCQNW